MEEVLFITVITAKLIGIYYSVSDWHGMDRWCRARAAVLAEDMDKLREMEMFREDGRDGVWTVMANVMDPESLRRAFDGCAGVFHTSAFVDPGGISGYTKHMARLEAQAAERVIEACVRTESVRKCVFTSSLLACVWRQNYPHDRRFPTIIDENCWSDESFCRDNKVSFFRVRWWW